MALPRGCSFLVNITYIKNYMKKFLLCTVLIATSFLATAQGTIKGVYFAQTHVVAPDYKIPGVNESLKLISNREALVKVNIISASGEVSPVVKANLDLNGTLLSVILTGPANLPTSFNDQIGQVVHSFDDSFTGVIPKEWLQPNLKVSIETPTETKNYNDLLISAPNKMLMTNFEVNVFTEQNSEYPSGWEEEFAEKLPASELNVQNVRVLFKETSVLPTGGRIAARITNAADYQTLTGFSGFGGNGGPQNLIATEWKAALRNAAGKFYGNMKYTHVSWKFENRANKGVGGGYSSVGRRGPNSLGILLHEMGHALSLPHWDGPAYPYKGDMNGIVASTVAGGIHSGPIWMYDVRSKKFIPPFQDGVTPLTYKNDPMSGGGNNRKEPGFLTNHFSDYSVNQMRNMLERHLVVYNEALGKYAKWNTTDMEYTRVQTNTNSLNYPIQRDVDVISIMAAVSSKTPQANIVYEPVGPYKSGLIRVFDPREATDRTDAVSNSFCPSNGCDTTLKIVQGSTTKYIMLSMGLDATLEATDAASFITRAVNLPASDGQIVSVELLSTPNVEVDGLSSSPTVIESWSNPSLSGVIPTFTQVADVVSGTTIAALPTTSNNDIIGSWAPAINNTQTTAYTFTPNSGQSTNRTAQMTITILSRIVPTFTQVAAVETGTTIAALPTTSNNGISGIWAPAINNTQTTTYTFTPNSGQSTNSTAQMTITILSRTVPTFTQVADVASGATVAALPTTSNNGITGTWAPAINNTQTTTYTFTPNSDQSTRMTTQMTIIVGVDNNNNGVIDTKDSNLYVTGNSTVFIAPGSFMYVASDLNVASGASFVASSNATASSSIIVKGNAVGEITYKRYISDTDWHIVSAPVIGQGIPDFVAEASNNIDKNPITNNFAVAYYKNTNASTQRWTYHNETPTLENQETLTNFENGLGYSMKRKSAGFYVFKGAVATANQAVLMNLITGSGTHFVASLGNPYPSFLSANNQTRSILKQNEAILDDDFIALYTWNKVSKEYDVLNYTTGDVYLSPNQGFIVISKTANQNFIFSKNLQSTQGNAGIFRKQAIAPNIILSLSKGVETKTTTLKFLSTATEGLDKGYDAAAYQDGMPSFSINSHLIADSKGVDFTLQCLPNSDYESYYIPLSVHANANETLRFSAETFNLPEGLSIYLEDTLKNTLEKINQKPYKVILETNTKGVGRFYLRTSSTVLSVKNNNVSKTLDVYKTANNTLRVIGFQEVEEASLKIFSITGKEVFVKSFSTESENNIDIPRLSVGVYLVQVLSEKNNFTKKIVIE
ncbi:T9SS type A sorting domain-containing protein [Polaribacter sp. IC066]|nr:T9SS type A sorting domain-containing protein [Polaribacter sp. IC066]